MKDVKNSIKMVLHIIFRKYLRFLQKRMISKNKYVQSIKEHYSNCLKELNYKTISPKYEIVFKDKDERFLNELKESYIEKHPSIYIRWISCAKPENIPRLKIQREVFTCKFNNIKFFGSSGGLVCKDLALMESAFNEFRFENCFMVDSKLLKHKNMKGVFTSIMHYFTSYSHHHWFIDNLPRLYGILKIDEPEINFIIPEEYNTLQLEILKVFLGNRFNIMKIKFNEVWNLEEYYFSSFSSSDCSGHMPKKYLDFVGNKMKEAYNIDNRIKNNRIFLSRSEDRWRNLVNENEVIEILKKYNFKVIHPKSLSIEKQIKEFDSAEIIIAPHGAALSNLIFAEECKVFELFPPYEFKSHFFMLSKALDFDYYFLKGEKQYDNNDFKVNIIEFEEKLKQLIKN